MYQIRFAYLLIILRMDCYSNHKLFRWLLFTGLLFYSNYSYAQPGRLSIRMAPLALADIYSGSCYKAGLEFKVTGQWALGIEGGGYFRKFNGLQNIKGHLSDLTIRYYLQGKNENGGLYFSINYTYKEQSFSYKDTIQESTPYLLKYRTRKYINCINLNVGLYSRTKSKLLFDIFGGMGVRIKNVHSTMTDSQFDKAKEYNDSQSLYFMVTPGKFVWPNLNFGLRVAYVLY